MARLAGELSGAHGDGVVLVAVLSGSVVFLADVVRAMAVEPVVDFLAVSSYGAGTGRVRILKDLDVDVAGRPVVVMADVVDTGLSLAYLLGQLERRTPRSLETCALVDRRGRRVVPVPLGWVGFEVDDELVLGYGLGHAERYRNLDLLAVADPGALAADPDVYVAQFYGR